MLLEGKVAIVTGAGRGIGREHALALAAQGAKVLVNDLGGSGMGDGSDAGPADDVAREIIRAGGSAVADTSNVAIWSEAQSIVAKAVDQFGRLDIVINNAGICRPSTLGSSSEADWDLQMNVNLKGSAAIMDAAAAHWRAVGPERGRAVINTSSPAGAHPLPEAGYYSVSKAGVLALTQVGAADLAGLGVRVNAIAPMARTRLTAPTEEFSAMMERSDAFDPFAPEHVSSLVIYLASGLCTFTGRLFGVWGKDIFLYKEWSADEQFPRSGSQSPEAIASLLEAVAPQSSRWEVALAGRELVGSPRQDVIVALQECSGRLAGRMFVSSADG